MFERNQLLLVYFANTHILQY